MNLPIQSGTQITLQDIEIILHKSRNHLQNAFAYVNELPTSRVKSLFEGHLSQQWEQQRNYEQALLQERRQARREGQFGLWPLLIGTVITLGAGGYLTWNLTDLWKHLTGASQTEDLAKCVDTKTKEFKKSGYPDETASSEALKFCRQVYGKQSTNIMGLLTSLLVIGGIGVGAYYIIKSLLK